MTGIITVIVVFVVAALLLAMRVPIMFALGLPALLGSLLLSTGDLGTAVGLNYLVGPFNLFSLAGLILWMVIGGVLLESGLMERYLTALHTLLGRQTTPARRESWAASVHGLPLTSVALLLVVVGLGQVDDHFLLLLLLPLLVITAVFAGLVLVMSAPKISQMTLKKMKSTDGEAWKQTAKATAEVREDGSVRKSHSKGQALLTLLAPFLLILVSIVLMLTTPIGLADLGGLVWLVVMVAAVITGGTKWIPDAGLQAILNVAYVASTAIAAFWLARLVLDAGIIPAQPVSTGNAIIWLLVGAMVLAVLLGTLLGSEAGAVFAFTILAPFFATGIDATDLAASVSALLLILLAAAAIIGGILARFLPPRTSPWPLTASPIRE